MKKIRIGNHSELDLASLRLCYHTNLHYELSPSANKKILASQRYIEKHLQDDKTAYGINTGFGKLASIKISKQKLKSLQKKLIESHATGVGEYLDDDIVKLILLLKIQTLARGYSGVRLEPIKLLLALLNKHLFPCIPCKGSVGASGDLAPLAHLSLVLLGQGQIRHHNKIISGRKALTKAKLHSIELAPKEGLALINGTQVSTALALAGLFRIENIFIAATLAGSLTTLAVGANLQCFDNRIQVIRNQKGQRDVAKVYRHIIGESKTQNAIKRMQEPYSIRCQPQVMGACLDQLRFAAEILHREANAVTDNPLIFAEANAILSGGNFHAQPVAMAADVLALVITEIGSIAERRIALLVDEHMSGLPPFLSDHPGIQSGFMSAQVTAAALVSENKSLAHPASVDSIPTSANQEDHVSMATFSARRLYEMSENTANVIAIELLAACQAIELSKTKKMSPSLKKVMLKLRENCRHYHDNYPLANDIDTIRRLILTGEFNDLIQDTLPSLRHNP